MLQNFGRLNRFKGRQTRGEFWPYAGVVILICYLAAGLVMVPIVGDFVQQAGELARSQPEAVTMQSGATGALVSVDAGTGVLPNVMLLSGGLGGVVALAVLLLAAAVSRRLHDSGLRAYWGLLPLPFLIGGLLLMPLLMREFAASSEPDLSLFFLLFGNNIVYLACLGALIILLCRPSSQGANTFDEAAPRT